jgi:hypothetical protein
LAPYPAQASSIGKNYPFDFDLIFVTVCLLPAMEEQGVQFEKVVDVRYQDKLERITVKIWHALDPTSHNRPLLHLQARSA